MEVVEICLDIFKFHLLKSVHPPGTHSSHEPAETFLVHVLSMVKGGE